MAGFYASDGPNSRCQSKINHANRWVSEGTLSRVHDAQEIRRRTNDSRTGVFLKTIQRYILRSILETKPLPPYVHGFVPGRSIVSNGETHRGAPYLLNVDIARFFDSIHETTVRQVFLDFGFGEDVAKTLTRLCCFQDSLPQGAPTSPYLANLAFDAADKSILALCREYGMTYSRYADDLSFSGPQ